MSRENRKSGGEEFGRGGVLPWVGTLLFVVSVVALIYFGLSGSDLTDARDDLAVWMLFLSAAVSLAGLWLLRAFGDRTDEELRESREETAAREEELSEARGRERKERERAERAVRDSKSLEHQNGEVRRELGRERYLRSRSEEAHRSVEKWRAQIHSEMMRLYGERGLIGGSRHEADDIPTMVLKLVMELVEAKKGILLSRGGGGEERLGVLAHDGFESDPTRSTLVKRFAGEVMERDRTLRESSPGGDGEADREIENMVAIPVYLQDEFDGVVVCANNPEGFDEYEDDVLLAVGDHAGAVLQNHRLQSDLKDSYLTTVGVLAEAMAVKEPSLRGHADDVADYVLEMADRFELAPERRETLIFGALLHDVGKIGISESILMKPASLNPEERAIIELHPRIGYQLIRRIPALKATAPAVLHHHERYDGAGYPSRLRGEEIPIESRIISVADSFSAMITDRPYRRRMSVSEALTELRRCAGGQFDPAVVEAFVEVVEKRPPSRNGDSLTKGDPLLSGSLNGHEPNFGYALLSVTDNLTNLYTRRHLYETAQAQARAAGISAKPFSVVAVKLGSVERTNRSMGYAAGDREIMHAAAIFRRVTSRHSGTASRYGDIRLAAVLPDMDAAGVSVLMGDLALGMSESAATFSCATWLPGDDGAAVIERAISGLPGAHDLDPELAAP